MDIMEKRREGKKDSRDEGQRKRKKSPSCAYMGKLYRVGIFSYCSQAKSFGKHTLSASQAISQLATPGDSRTPAPGSFWRQPCPLYPPLLMMFLISPLHELREISSLTALRPRRQVLPVNLILVLARVFILILPCRAGPWLPRGNIGKICCLFVHS